MTSNQIAFYKAKQEAKHWRRQDKLAKQQNVLTEKQIAETQRHNFASESLNQQEIDIKDQYNKANIALGYENAAINRTHYTNQDLINQAHYERADANAEKLGRIQNDQLILQAINTLGEPVDAWTLDESGNKVKQYDASRISFSDYYNGTNTPYVFGTSPLALDYLSPSALSGYGKALSGVSSLVGAVNKLFTPTR